MVEPFDGMWRTLKRSRLQSTHIKRCILKINAFFGQHLSSASAVHQMIINPFQHVGIMPNLARIIYNWTYSTVANIKANRGWSHCVWKPLPFSYLCEVTDYARWKDCCPSLYNWTLRACDIAFYTGLGYINEYVMSLNLLPAASIRSKTTSAVHKCSH